MKKELLDILACPVCKGDVHLSKEEHKIICDDCGRKYHIEDGIPIMLKEEAELEE